MSAELELYEEELEQADMSTLEHSAIASTINREIGLFIKGKNMGRVFDSSAEYRFLEKQEGDKRKPARQPDVSFVCNERLPKRLRSYPHIVPDLVVEVESPSDLPYQVEAKIEEYQKAGVRLLWQVRPYSRRIDVYRFSKGLIPEPIGIEGELSGENVLPGFTLAVAEVFDFPADSDPEPDK